MTFDEWWQEHGGNVLMNTSESWLRLHCRKAFEAGFAEGVKAARRLANLPPPVLDPERMKQSQEQMERGEGFTTEEILADLRSQEGDSREDAPEGRIEPKAIRQRFS